MPDPVIQDPEDVIVRVDAVTICGTDLHILKGDVPTVDHGRILGHEAVGTITEVGDSVRGVTSGDRVLISCITSCGRCEYCRQGRYGQCLGGGGWILGHLIDGTQAEQVRVPFADRSVYKLPDNVSNESALQPSRRRRCTTRSRGGSASTAA
ncbi:alcohol dehydrogenase-like protein [Kribbella orskensis]|uniref:Alcohol dehydrogenase-like protein n=1 Tax=Kribbella orskensis TaxID=2512216 RepID=A0ABY2BAR2_9ACTN|nr:MULTISPECIES: alcohol dehydrogenase catalytic domain-containing protein [Kribbella]TCN31217.1 alcohol dehydrogenase-like protein [Kribbella sp. VKM Ac-2500]TCO11723.1 alcohol dehydrogenase-like protein [Kribbella orskensis]